MKVGNTLKISVLSFVIVLIFGLMSCKTHCSEFDKTHLSWIPYQANDVIELYSQSMDSTITFSIKNVEASHTTHYSFGSKCGGGSDEIFIEQNENDNFRFHVNIYLHENKITSQNYLIGDTYFSTYSEETKYIFENKEYDVVRILNVAHEGTFKKLIMAKDIGIIGLVDINDNIWVLKTDAKIRKNDTLNNIVIHNVSC